MKKYEHLQTFLTSYHICENGDSLSHVAKLVAITEVSNSGKLRPFVDFGANLKNINLREEEKVALLRVENTQSYIAVFLEREESLEDVEKGLKDIDAILSDEAKKALEKHLG